MQKGELKGEKTLLTKLLKQRFGVVDTEYLSKIELADAKILLHWAEKILEAKTLDDVFGTWH